MNDLITLVSGIEFKAREIAARYAAVKNENEELKQKNKQLLSKLEEKETNLKQTQYKNQIIKIAKAIEREKGSTNAKRLINELLREVDRCIGLMND
jgi:cell division septum initiation protein DivIVA